MTSAHDQLLAHVLERADQLGLLCHSCPDSRICNGDPGLPDLIIVGIHGVIFAELKTGGGGIEPAQQTWRYTLLASGQLWQLWRPADWPDSIETMLKAIV